MRVTRYVGVIGALGLLIVGLESGRAQPYSREQLLSRGNAYWQSNCVISAMNYFAILQQFPGWPDPNAIQRMRNRIQSCQSGSVGMAGTDAKNDGAGQSTTIVLPPMIQPSAVPQDSRARACKAYAATAVVQAQAQRDARCNQGGNRWSTDYRTHYNWCMAAGTPQNLQFENNARSSVVNACVLRW
jgi:hypothetical protein